MGIILEINMHILLIIIFLIRCRSDLLLHTFRGAVRFHTFYCVGQGVLILVLALIIAVFLSL